ncbi:MAG TPA: SET domain-containing protein-lysine N-methyltransferase, partial [Aggregatilineales bacterium]|nr:SET domain-containing protein-lysine N-methyltransferase [Aggregatilineales bacterium]
FETSGTFLTHQTEHTLQLGWDLHLEPDSPIRLMNHSCEPAAGVKTNARNLPDFYAFRDIKKGEEITFDYAMTEYAHYPREDASLEFSLECRCGAPSCRGKLGYYSELSDEIKTKYAGYVSAYLVRPQKG